MVHPFLTGLSAVYPRFHPAHQIGGKFVAVQFVVQFVARAGIQLEGDVPHPRGLQPAVHLPHAAPVAADGIHLPRKKGNGQPLRHPPAPFPAGYAVQQAEQIAKAAVGKDKVAFRIAAGVRIPFDVPGKPIERRFRVFDPLVVVLERQLVEETADMPAALDPAEQARQKDPQACQRVAPRRPAADIAGQPSPWRIIYRRVIKEPMLCPNRK